MPNIGIIGRARVGKDTAGAWLVEHRGYVRVGFADVLKDAAVHANPWVDYEIGSSWELKDVGIYRLADVVERWGWEEVKVRFPESRRFLQDLGMAIRAIDEDFWLRAALARVQEINESGRSVVITDVRFPNEAESLKRAGFELLYIDRPDIPHLDHASEGALTADDAHHYIGNDGSLDEFLNAVRFTADIIAGDVSGLARTRAVG